MELGLCLYAAGVLSIGVSIPLHESALEKRGAKEVLHLGLIVIGLVLVIVGSVISWR